MYRKLLIVFIIFIFTCKFAEAGDSPLFYYAALGDTAGLKALIKEGAKVDFKDDKGNTALMYAAMEGKLDAVKLLVKSGADINARSSAQITPLIFSANAGYFDVVRYLVEKGADTNAYGDNNKAATAYGYAKKNGHSQIADYLESRTSIRVVTAQTSNEVRYRTSWFDRHRSVAIDCSNGKTVLINENNYTSTPYWHEGKTFIDLHDAADYACSK